MTSFQKEVILDPSSYFLLDFGQFRSFPVTSGRVFMHPKIVSSLFYNISEAQRCISNHMSTPDEMKKAVRGQTPCIRFVIFWILPYTFFKKNSRSYLLLVEEAFGYTKLIYLKYTSKMCEVYFPKVSKRSLQGWTFSQIPR